MWSCGSLFQSYLARYDWNKDPHDHMKCTSCGRMVDIELPNDDLKKMVKNQHDFEVSDVEITLIGKCNKHD